MRLAKLKPSTSEQIKVIVEVGMLGVSRPMLLQILPSIAASTTFCVDVNVSRIHIAYSRPVK